MLKSFHANFAGGICIDIVAGMKNTLFFNGKEIKFSNNVSGIALGRTAVFILLFEEKPDGSVVLTNQPLNNIYAYDYEGNLKWNISEITGDVPNPFGTVSIHSKKSISEFMKNRFFDPNDAIDGHEFLYCSDIGGLHYVIDVTDKRLIYRKGFRF